MKKLIYLLLPLSMMVASCNAQTADNSDVTVTQAKEMIDNKDVVILDVRTPGEYENGHIEGATLIDYNGADFDEKIAQLDKNKEYVVYCHSGNRSGKAVKKMNDAGFTNTHNMLGGWSAWSQESK